VRHQACEGALRTRRWTFFSILAIAPVASVLLVQGANAQASACERLKATLAARIDPSIRGFTLESVPSSTPTPPGAKVIGTCEGGAQKILFRRSGSAQSPVSSASAVAPASTPETRAVVETTNRRLAQVPSVRATQPATTSAPITPAPLASQANEAVSAVPTPLADAGGSGASAGAVASAGGIDATRVDERATVRPTPASPDSTPAHSASFTERASEFLSRYWHWIAMLVLVILGAALWAALVHRLAYDASGLPRGPKIR
jgi:Protein of unknown function (DUF1161)